MAATSSLSSSLLAPKTHLPTTTPFKNSHFISRNSPTRRVSLRVRAAKLPAGVELPKAEPKFRPPFAGFTRTAETWNSRACMIGLIGTFIVELIIKKGILEVIGVEIGKGLDIPL